MNIDQLLKCFEAGLKETLRSMHDFSEDPDTATRPEYLATTAIARALKESVGSSALIRLEQDTSRTLNASVLPPNRPSSFSNCVSRPGEVDIVLSVEENSWKYPVILIENKLYVAGYSTIEDDAIRCAEFVAAQDSTGSIEVAAVTYFRQETQGVITSHQEKAGNRAPNRIKSAAAELAAQWNVCHRHKRIKLYSTALESKDHALSEDETGMPAYLAQPTFTVWGAVELFFQTDRLSRLSRILQASCAEPQQG